LIKVIAIMLVNGVSLGSILLLSALGLSVTFGLMRVINMAHGEFLMIGAYTTFVVQNLFLAYLPQYAFDLYFPISLAASFFVSALFGIVLEAVVISKLYGREIDSLLATWGVSLLLRQAARSIFGAPNVNVIAPSFLNGVIRVGGAMMSIKRTFIIGLAAASLLIVWGLMYKSSFGSRMRACIQNRNMAQCLGIKVRLVDSMTFAIGSGIAGMAGCALTLLGSVGPTLGGNYLVDAFMVVVLGGVGRLKGAVFGAIVIGLCGTIIEFETTASIAKAAVLVLVIIFLQKKPQGFFTVRSRALDEV
jgi:urea transport system permease protein